MSTTFSEILDHFNLDDEEKRIYTILLTLGDKTEESLLNIVGLPKKVFREKLKNLKEKGLVLELKDGLIRYVPFYPLKLASVMLEDALGYVNQASTDVLKTQSDMTGELTDIFTEGKKRLENDMDKLFEGLLEAFDEILKMQEKTKLDISELLNQTKSMMNSIQNDLSLIDENLKEFKNFVEGELKMLISNQVESITAVLEEIKGNVLESVKQPLVLMVENIDLLRENSAKTINNAMNIIMETRDKISDEVDAFKEALNASHLEILEKMKTEFVNRVETLDSLIDSFYSGLENEFIKVIEEMGQSFLKEVNDSIQSFRGDIQRIYQNSKAMLNQTFDELQKSLKALSTLIIEEISTFNREVISNLDELEINLKEVIKKTIGDLLESNQGIYNIALTDLNNLKTNVIKGLQDSIEALRQKLRGVNLSISKIIDGFYEVMIARNQKIRGSLVKYIDEVHSNLLTYRLHLSRYSRELYKGIIKSLNERDTAIKNSIQTLFNKLDEALSSTRDELIGKLDSVYANYLDKFFEIDSQFTERVLSASQSLIEMEEERLAKNKEDFQNKVKNLEEAFLKLGEEKTQEGIMEAITAVKQIAEENIASEKAFIKNLKLSIEKELKTFLASREKNYKLSKRKTKEYISKAIASQLDEIGGQLSDLQSQINDLLSKEESFVSSSANIISSKVEEELDKILDIYKNRSDEIKKEVLDMLKNSIDTEFKQIGEFKNSLIEEIKKDLEELDGISESAKSYVDEAIDDLSNAYMKAMTNLNEKTKSLQGKLVKEILDTKGLVVDKLEENLEKIKESFTMIFEQRTKSFTDSIEEMLKKLEETDKSIETEAFNLNKSIAEISKRGEQKFSGEAEKVREHTIKTAIEKIKDLEQSFLEMVNSIKDEINQLSIEKPDELKEAISSATSVLQKTLDEISLEYTKAIDTLKQETTKLLEHIPVQLNTALTEKEKELKDKASKLLTEIDDAVINKTIELSSRVTSLNKDLAKLNELSSEKSAKIENKLLEASNSMRSAKNDLTERKREIEETLIKSLTDLQERFLNDIKSGLDKVEEEIISFRNQSKRFQDDIVKLHNELISVIEQRKHDYMEIYTYNGIINELSTLIEKSNESILLATPVIEESLVNSIKKVAGGPIIEVFTVKNSKLGEIEEIEGVKIRTTSKDFQFIAAIIDNKTGLLSLNPKTENSAGIITWDEQAIDAIKKFTTGIIAKMGSRGQRRR
ncbi:MAG: helix-turn-helix domain-containing protein [Candidatus Njordarchaeia archaeon]